MTLPPSRRNALDGSGIRQVLIPKQRVALRSMTNPRNDQPHIKKPLSLSAVFRILTIHLFLARHHQYYTNQNSDPLTEECPTIGCVDILCFPEAPGHVGPSLFANLSSLRRDTIRTVHITDRATPPVY